MAGINSPMWMQAVEDQMSALHAIDRLLYGNGEYSIQRVSNTDSQNKGWSIDKRILVAAAPFAWSEETTQAVLAASKSIPLDTLMNKWNLATETVWWHFEKPLPFQTINFKNIGIKAIAFGWIPTAVQDFGMPVCCWLKTGAEWGESVVKQYPIIPSQVWEWERDSTIREMLNRTQQYHQQRYGPGGKDEFIDHIPEDIFMATTEAVSKFIIAGLAWLNQKVLVTESGHIERHRRKAFSKAGKTIREVQVIHLRKYDHQTGAEIPASGEPVEWSCRWTVDGHWRNQACGPNHNDHRLTWVMPYIKGPDDKPLKIPARKIYEVSR